MKANSILVIDDDTDDIDLFCEAVNEIDSSIECSWALNCNEALELLESEKLSPDLIFLDLNMPGLDGRQCLEKLKLSDLLSPIPVYILSTSALQADIDFTQKLGASGYLTKPPAFEVLKNSLSGIIKKNNSSNNYKLL